MSGRTQSDNPSCFWPREEIERAREVHFATMLDLAFARHPFYRARFAAAGLSRADISSLADLSKLPVTTKQDYMDHADDFVLETQGLDDEMRTVWDTMYTTGSTTGRPTPFVSTSYDFYNILTINRNMMLLRGVTEEDSVANLFPLTRHPHGAFTRAQQAPAVMNIPVVAALPGNPSPYFTHGNSTAQAVRVVERSRATILWGVPSFIRRLLQTAAELDADFSAVRMVFVTGEALYPEARRDLSNRLRALGATEPVISGSYGMTEMQGGHVECAEGMGFHNPMPDQMVIEVVDPETHRPVPDGEEGLVLLSHLNRRGTVLLRYQIGDVSVLSRDACPHCGAVTDRLVRTPRRVDSLVKIKGMLVNPEPVLAALATDDAIARFRLVIDHADAGDPLSGDVLRLVAVPVAGAAGDDLAARLSALVKDKTGITPEVQLTDDAGFAPEAESWKEKALEDRRGSAGA
jgi:phenylacetate-coenzyme A ligase PaaK-like adenylate-forming protein